MPLPGPLALLPPPAFKAAAVARAGAARRAKTCAMAALDFKPGRISLEEYEQRRQACTEDALAR